MRIFFTFLFSIILLSSQAQDKMSLRFSYLGHYLYQPGLKASLHLNIFEKSKEKSTLSLFAEPGLGFYSHINANSHVIAGTELGLKRVGQKGFESSLSVGVNGCYRAVLLGLSSNLGNGETSSKDYEHRIYFLPTLNLTLGKNYEKLGWFIKASPGYFLSPNHPRSFALFAEVGIIFSLKKKEE